MRRGRKGINMLHIYCPPCYTQEREYIMSVMFDEFLGLPYQFFEHNERDIRIVLHGDPCEETAKELLITEVLLQSPKTRWLTESSLPATPLDQFESPGSAALPVIYGRRLQNGHYVNKSDARIELGIDVFGSIFFMLTRYEELVKADRDERARFPASASLAYREGFLERPIVNEYVELLYRCLTELWPALSRKQRDYRICLSHDVDVPLHAAGRRLPVVIKNIAGDLLKRKSLAAAVKRIRSFICGKFGNYDADDGNTFGFIMQVSEQKGVQSAFNFIAGHSGGAIDGDYSIDDPWIRQLLTHIHKRGHEIGLHPSYNSYNRPETIEREFAALKRACEQQAIDQERWGGRQHFLRFDAAATWHAWDAAGLHYDSTLGFADHVGFRTGVCYEYPVFHLPSRQRLKLRERPLIVMEQSLLYEDYMKASHAEAYDKTIRLAQICKKFQGDFTLLWHNDKLIESKDRELYRSIVEAI